ncbi:hypothetical protein SAMN05660206_11939, partial [Sphingobacterium wenxiniae]
QKSHHQIAFGHDSKRKSDYPIGIGHYQKQKGIHKVELDVPKNEITSMNA